MAVLGARRSGIDLNADIDKGTARINGTPGHGFSILCCSNSLIH